MKKTSFFSKLLYFINSILATLLLLSYLLPYVSPKTIPLLAVISLIVPVLIVLNIAFLIYWLIKIKKHFFLSAIVLAIGWFVASPFYKFSEKKVLLNNDIKVMSYNVRLFNAYKWSKDENTAQNIIDLIAEKDADILAIQEYYNTKKGSLKYPYKYVKLKSHSFGAAIFSKYPIINSGSLDLKKTSNNIIFTDIVKEKDTIRVYNVHLQSLGINPEKENFGQENSEKLVKRISNAFYKQASQIEQFLEHEKSWKGKKIVCGDFNNTAYSWVYKKVSSDKKDAFVTAGKGFGKSFNYPFPTRIDYIFTDKTATINYFKTFDKKYSDHFPILARINWDN